MVLAVLIAALAAPAAPAGPGPSQPGVASDEEAPAQTAAAESTSAEPATDREAHPTVHVVADEKMTEWLLLRLLDDGYPLVAYRAAADVELTVTATAQGHWTITATGQSTSTFNVEAADDPAVTQLEVLHRSFDALEAVEPMKPTQPPPPAVSLTIAEGSPPSLAPQVALGVLAAGARLSPSRETGSFQICASQRGETAPEISVIEAELDCASTDGSSVADPASPTEPTVQPVARADGAIVLRSSELVTAAMVRIGLPAEDGFEPPWADPVAEAAPAAPPATDSEAAPGLESDRTPDRRKRSRPVVIRWGVGAGVLGRRAEPREVAADGLITPGMSLGFEPGIAGWLELQIRPSVVVDPLVVVETFPAIGLRYRTFTVRRVSVDVGALFGPEIHTYRLTRDGFRTRNGNHVVASAEAMLGFAVKFWKEHEFHAQFRLGGGRERIHETEDTVLWRRRALRFGAVVGISLGKVLRS